MNEDRLRRQLRGLSVRTLFKPVLELFENDPLTEYSEKLLEDVKEKSKGILNPDLIVRVSILEEQVELRRNLTILVKDIVNLDWNKEETELQYESMKKCFENMNKRNDEISVLITEMGIGEDFE